MIRCADESRSLFRASSRQHRRQAKKTERPEETQFQFQADCREG